jgi:hypothetical protein
MTPLTSASDVPFGCHRIEHQANSHVQASGRDGVKNISGGGSVAH